MALADFGLDAGSLRESAEPATDVRRLLGLPRAASPRRSAGSRRAAGAVSGDDELTWDRVVAADLSPNDARVYALLRRLRHARADN